MRLYEDQADIVTNRRKLLDYTSDNNKRPRVSSTTSPTLSSFFSLFRVDARGYNLLIRPPRVRRIRETLIYELDERDDYIPPLSRASFQARNPISFLLLIHSVQHYHPLISAA